MTTTAPRIKAMALQASMDPRRSPLFHWLKRRHDALAPLLVGRRVNWTPVITAIEKAGITDYAGGVPNEHTLRRTWRTVRRVVEAEQAAKAVAQTVKPERKLQPRDLPTDWKPTPVAAPSPVPAASPPGVAAAGQPPTALPPLSHPDQVRVVGQASFGPITRGPLTPEPDYTGMGVAERKVARTKWYIALREPG